MTEEMKNTLISDAAVLNLIKYGTLTKEVKIGNDVVFVLKTLTQSDREEYSKLVNIPKDSNKDTMYTMLECSKVPMLTYAITKINNSDFSSKESKEQLIKLLQQLPPTVIDILYTAHIENEDQYYKMFSEENNTLKKN